MAQNLRDWKPRYEEEEEDDVEDTPTYNPELDDLGLNEVSTTHALSAKDEHPLLPAFSFNPGSTDSDFASGEADDAQENEGTVSTTRRGAARHGHRRSSSVSQIAASEIPRTPGAPPGSPIDFRIPPSPRRRAQLPDISIPESSSNTMIDLDAAIPSPDTPRSHGRSFSMARQSMHSRGHVSVSNYDMSDVFEEDEESETAPSTAAGPTNTTSLPDLTALMAMSTPDPKADQPGIASLDETTRRYSTDVAAVLGASEAQKRKPRRFHQRVLKLLHIRKK